MSTTGPAADTNTNTDSTLPTRPIPFHFLISTNPPHKLTRTHDVPAVLLEPTPEPADRDLFVETLSDALVAHRDECRDSAPKECDVCGQQAESVIQTPVSFLHVGTEAAEWGQGQTEGFNGGGDAAAAADTQQLGKRVEVIVTPICGNGDCAQLARQRVRRVVEGMQEETQAQARAQAQAEAEAGSEKVPTVAGPEDSRCMTCGASKDTKKCTGCEVARYCSKECQRKDWKSGHKRVCGAL